MKNGEYVEFSKAYGNMLNEADAQISFVEYRDRLEILVNGEKAGYVDFDKRYLDDIIASFEEMELGFDLKKLSRKITYGERVCYIEQLYVKMEFRKMGLAGMLINKLIGMLHSVGVFQIVLRAEPDKETIPVNKLVSFYQKFGFKEIDRTEEGGVLMVKL